MSADKQTIGITNENLAALQSLISGGHFASELDAAKFAMAYAIKNGALAGRAEGAPTKWNVGSVDPNGNLRSMLSAFYPTNEEPYRLMEHLMNKGLADLAASRGGAPDIYGIMFKQ